MFFKFPDNLLGRHYLIWITTGFLLGVFYALYGNVLRPFFLSPFLWYTSFFCGCVLFLLLLSRPILHRKALFLYRDLFLCWIVLLSVALGIFHVNHYDQSHHKSLKATANQEQTYTAVITDKPTLSKSASTVCLPLRILSVREVNTEREVDGAILLYAPAKFAQSLSLDDGIRFTTTLKTPRDASYSGGFSGRNYLYGDGYSFQAFTDAVEPIDVKAPFSFPYGMRRMGIWMQDLLLNRLDLVFPESTRESALMKGILLGNRSNFTAEQYKSFQDSGLVHITAVSGMHIMFLLGFLNSLLRRLRLPKRLTYLVIVPVLLLLAITVAFTPSVCRAVIMILFIIISNLLHREAHSPTSLFAAALFLVLLNPYTLLQYSFLLSFGATLGIIIFTPLLLQRLTNLFPSLESTDKKWYTNIVEYVFSSVSVSLAGTFGICYFMARFFHQISWGGILANISVLILTSWSFVGGILVILLSFVAPALAQWLEAYPLRLILWCINEIANIFSLPFFRILTPTPNYFDFLLYLLGGFALYLLLQPKKNKLPNQSEGGSFLL